MYILSATNKLKDGETHFATLLTITSSSSINSIMRKFDGRGSPSVDTGTSNREDTVRCRDSLAFVLNPDPLNGQHKKKCSAPGAPEEEDARWARMWELQEAGDFQGLPPSTQQSCNLANVNSPTNSSTCYSCWC